ncbi:hypothetical protein ABIB40_000998 [Pedobacter sp. UYP30]|uniref:glucosaminidase domain-containing protein n=1 Tax=Pedobacter sp. UYP30 TaxID=1756400 RepID=UPI00339A0CD8
MKKKNCLMLFVSAICLFIGLLSATKAKATATEEYIAAHLDCAQNLMRTYKVPASLILAVAIHESASGNSKIARYLNNHFGVKGPNSNTEIRSAYRDYDSPDESYQGFIDFLEDKSSFKSLFDTCDQYNYRAWARGIQRGGYAHSRTWSSQVIAIIQKYQLYQYDERPEDYIEPTYHARPSKMRKKHRIYVVKRGDNLNSIADKKGTTVKTLMKKNGLKNSLLQPGKRLRY